MSIKPVKINKYKTAKYALILPNGDLYKVDFFGKHCTTAYELQNAGILYGFGGNYDGCVHISDYEFDHIERGHKSSKRVTQKQADTMFDYMMAVGKTFTFDILEIIDEKPKV